MSTYSPSLRVELITQGDQAGTWGTTTNENFAYIFDAAIAGYVPVAVSTTDHVLTYTDGPVADENLNQSIAAMLRLTSAAAAFNVFAPPVSKQYIIWNSSGYAATIYNSTSIGNTTAAGVGVTIANGDRVIVFSNGTDFYEVKSTNVTGVVAIANGGTGQTTATAAFNALAPSQTGNNGRYLKSDGTNASWDAIDLSTADITGVLPAANGGTGVNNGSSTITLAGNVTHAGAFTQSFTATGNTAVTLPTTGTLATLAGSETLTNKTLTSPTLNSPTLTSPTLTNPTLISPALGTPTSGNLANCTFPIINPRTSSTASTSTLTPDISAFEQYNLTAQATGLTVAAPIGTLVDGYKLIIRILDNGTSRTISWNATYTAIGVILPTATVVSKMLYVGCIYNAANTRWDVVAVVTQV